MQTNDAHIFRGSTLQHISTLDCTRWQEAQECVGYFCNVAATLQLPTRFIMMNDLGRMFGPSQFSIGENGIAQIPTDFSNAHTTLQRAYPSGPTPLAKHVTQIRNMIAPMAAQLQREGKTISVILATDGLPSDENGNEGHIILNQFVQSLKSLEGLPVWVVVRLCTDDEKVVDFYNSIDYQLNLPYDVLDDFFGEALEVYLRNPWLNYALPLHRLRELGFAFPVLDNLDEHALSYQHLHQLCQILFQQGRTLPDPAGDWVTFLRALSSLMAREQFHFNPITKRLEPWIDLSRLHLVYGRNLSIPPELQQQQPFYPSSPLQTYHQPQFGRPPSTSTMMPASHVSDKGSVFQQPPTPGTMPSSPPYQQPRQEQYHFQSTQQQHQNQQQNLHNQKDQEPHHHHQPQHWSPPPPPPPPSPSASMGPPSSKYQTATIGDSVAVKNGVLQWAVLGNHIKPIDQILGSIHQTFPPAFGLPGHAYFSRWKPFSLDALRQRQILVIKRGMYTLRPFSFGALKSCVDFMNVEPYKYCTSSVFFLLLFFLFYSTT